MPRGLLVQRRNLPLPVTAEQVEDDKVVKNEKEEEEDEEEVNSTDDDFKDWFLLVKSESHFAICSAYLLASQPLQC